jgi:hypothetical protein
MAKFGLGRDATVGHRALMSFPINYTRGRCLTTFASYTDATPLAVSTLIIFSWELRQKMCSIETQKDGGDGIKESNTDKLT